MDDLAKQARRVGFSGTRFGMTEQQSKAVAHLLYTLRPVAELHHGDCTGADEQADLIAHELLIGIVIHPPLNPRFRAWCRLAAEYRPPMPYIARDYAIVDETDVLIAAPKSPVDEAHSGTWVTINYAIELGRPVVLAYRSGYTEWFGDAA